MLIWPDPCRKLLPSPTRGYTRTRSLPAYWFSEPCRHDRNPAETASTEAFYLQIFHVFPSSFTATTSINTPTSWCVHFSPTFCHFFCKTWAYHHNLFSYSTVSLSADLLSQFRTWQPVRQLPRAGSGVVRLTRSVSWPDVVQGD